MTPEVALNGSKIRLEADAAKYRLDLWEAQEFASDLMLSIEAVNSTYNPPQTRTRTRTLNLGPRRKIKVTMSRDRPAVFIEHPRVLVLSTDEAGDLAEVVVSTVEAVEDRSEAAGIEPYPSETG